MIRRYLRGLHSFVSKSVVLSFDERKLSMTLSDLGRTRSCCVFVFRARVTLLTSSIEFISVSSNPTSSLAFVCWKSISKSLNFSKPLNLQSKYQHRKKFIMVSNISMQRNIHSVVLFIMVSIKWFYCFYGCGWLLQLWMMMFLNLQLQFFYHPTQSFGHICSLTKLVVVLRWVSSL